MASSVTRRTRTADSHLPLILIAIAGGVGLLLVSVIVGAVLLRSSAPAGSPNAPLVQAVGPRQDKEGVEWNHKELVEYLKSQGAKVKWRQTPYGFLFGPAIYMYPDHPANNALTEEQLRDSGAVYCQKRKTAQEAKDAAGATKAPSFSWGCFYFEAKTPEHIDAIKSLLK
jgi:hypothetical protein